MYQDSFPQGEFETQVLNKVALLERQNSGGSEVNPFEKNNGGGGIGGGDGGGTSVSVGGGLAGRAVISRRKIGASPQKQGKVVIEVCVDNSGHVVSAYYTPRGSTTSDSELQTMAISAAQTYKFAPPLTQKNAVGLRSLSARSHCLTPAQTPHQVTG